MAIQVADKRRVYVAYQAIFVGPKADLRKAKKVREEIKRRPQLLKPLTSNLSTENVVEILRDLLARNIFKSEAKAKAEFPDLFHPPPEQVAEREASEVDAAKSTAEVLDEVASVDRDDTDRNDVESNDARCDDEAEDSAAEQAGEVPYGMERDIMFPKPELSGAETSIPQQMATLPSLYPTYIPYKTQHIILSEAQRMLEESCFEFTKAHLPALLENTGLDCASSLELTKWTRLLAKMANELPETPFNAGETPLKDVLFATDKLRHSAVHRVPMTARGIRDLLKSAAALAATVSDRKHAGQLEEICNELDDKVKTMELNKNALVLSATAELQDIQRRREELDMQEKEVLANVVKSDRKQMGLIGILLEDSVGRILEGKTEIGTEMEDKLKLDEDEEAFSEYHTSSEDWDHSSSGW